MPRKLIQPHLLFSDLGARLLDQELQFLYFNVRKLSFGHVRHIPRQVHIALFQLYPTSLPCHSSGHVENLQEVSCYFVTMRFGDYLNHICFHSLIYSDYSLFCPLSGMLIRKFIWGNPRANNITMFDFPDSAAGYHCQRRRFAVMGSGKLVV
jgi:hypothetical protein